MKRIIFGLLFVINIELKAANLLVLHASDEAAHVVTKLSKTRGPAREELRECSHAYVSQKENVFQQCIALSRKQEFKDLATFHFGDTSIWPQYMHLRCPNLMFFNPKALNNIEKPFYFTQEDQEAFDAADSEEARLRINNAAYTKKMRMKLDEISEKTTSSGGVLEVFFATSNTFEAAFEQTLILSLYKMALDRKMAILSQQNIVDSDPVAISNLQRKIKITNAQLKSLIFFRDLAGIVHGIGTSA